MHFDLSHSIFQTDYSCIISYNMPVIQYTACVFISVRVTYEYEVSVCQLWLVNQYVITYVTHYKLQTNSSTTHSFCRAVLNISKA